MQANAPEQIYHTETLTRVEGEGTLHLVARGQEIIDARFKIWEAPRYFEAFIVGRHPDEVIDIVARICGICPIAYQMGASYAFESIFGVQVDPQVRALRRLIYLGEWIESHPLHIYALHAPDFLGYMSALDLAKDNRAVVEQGLQLKKLGNDIMSVLGGRSVHPVSMRVGGFHRVPKASELAPLRGRLDDAIQKSIATLELVSTFDAPAFEREVKLVSLHHPSEYAMTEGRIVSSDGEIDIAIGDWPKTFIEEQHEGTNALHVRTKDGGVYLLGPSARVTNNHEQLHPVAKEALAKSGLLEAIKRNPFWSIAARSVETIHACAESADIIDAYVRPAEPYTRWTPRAGSGAWGTEAPRGICSHNYTVDEKGLVTKAQIIAPTGPNQSSIERDLALFAPQILDLDHAAATWKLEQLIRCYDPCISCATHFLDLTIERV